MNSKKRSSSNAILSETYGSPAHDSLSNNPREAPLSGMNQNDLQQRPQNLSEFLEEDHDMLEDFEDEEDDVGLLGDIDDDDFEMGHGLQ